MLAIALRVRIMGLRVLAIVLRVRIIALGRANGLFAELVLRYLDFHGLKAR